MTSENTSLIGDSAMTEIEIIKKAFQDHLKWNAVRIDFLANFLLALLKVRSVNLVEIATAFSRKTKRDSNYKRLQRFFRFFPIDFSTIGKLIVQLLPIKDKPWILTMDRTNWKFGKLDINPLVLGIAYKGIAFPILWIPLPKRGSSNTAERIELIDRFIRIFGITKIKCLTADREFIGQEWFGYLLNKLILFRIRIHENFLVTNARGIPVPAKRLFRGLRPGEWRVLKGKRMVLGHELFIVGLRLSNEEYLILATNNDPELAIKDYSQRWEIETLFGCLKSRGFRFESTHMTNPKRISKLLALLAIAFCWCHITGEWVHSHKPIKIKKHGRKAISISRYGLDQLREILLNISHRMRDFKKMVLLLLKQLVSPLMRPT
jgi:hypothetical protein